MSTSFVKLFFASDTEVIQLPVNPEELTVSREGNNSTQEIVKIGEINILKLPKLATITIPSFFPFDDSAPYTLTKGKDFKSPDYLINFFENARDNRTPVIFKILRARVSGEQKGQRYSVENFNFTYDGGDYDIKYNLDLKQWKNYGAKTFETTFNVAADENGMIKVVNKPTRFQNVTSKGKQALASAANVVKTATRFANNAQHIMNGIRSTGSVIHVVTNL